MGEEHLHGKIGKAISDCKQRLYKRLKAGANLEDSIAAFVGELRLALDELVMNR